MKRIGVIRLAPDDLAPYRASLGFPTAAAALSGLARGLTARGFAAADGVEQVVVRARPEPVLGLVHDPSSASGERLAAQGRALRFACRRMRYFDFPAVQRLIEGLADQLWKQLGAEALGAARFAAIPRGGWVVLGLLAYELGLGKNQLTALTALTAEGEPGGQPGPAGALVVVDDCALTGLRLRRALLGRRDPPETAVLFAHLCSPRGLRQAIEASSEVAVSTCLAAEDLRDLGDEISDVDNPGWRARWAERLHGDRLWRGVAEPIAFPWSEPDRLVLDPAAEGLVRGWPLVPPELCRGNRPRVGEEEVPVVEALAVESALAVGRWRLSRHALCADLGSRVVMGQMESGDCAELDEMATALWRAALEEPSLDAAADRLAAEYDAPRERIAMDLETLLDDLQSRGFLVEQAVDHEPR